MTASAAALAWRLQTFESVGSTSELCRAAAAEGEPEGLAILARQQTQGRGSRGRDWASPPGNLALSVLLRPLQSAREAAQWSLLAGVAVVDALAPLLPEAAALSLKWPNDVLLNGHKLGGILVDSAADAGGVLEWLVIGMGVNLAHAADVPGRATACIADVVPPPTPDVAAVAVLDTLARWCGVRQVDGFAPVRAAWLRRAPAIGTKVAFRLTDREFSGDFAGLGEDGSLLLRTDGRVRAFSTGEILGS